MRQRGHSQRRRNAGITKTIAQARGMCPEGTSTTLLRLMYGDEEQTRFTCPGCHAVNTHPDDVAMFRCSKCDRQWQGRDPVIEERARCLSLLFCIGKLYADDPRFDGMLMARVADIERAIAQGLTIQQLAREVLEKRQNVEAEAEA